MVVLHLRGEGLAPRTESVTLACRVAAYVVTKQTVWKVLNVSCIENLFSASKSS